jgi:tetratricopeptide (TPR) repeat protein
MELLNHFENSGPKEGAPMTEYHPGDVFYGHENGEYNLYKVIRSGEDGYVLVRGFWISTIKPTSANWKTFELRNTCEALEISECDRPTFVTYESVTAEEEAGYEEFQRIAEGMRKRAEEFSVRLTQADSLMGENREEEALALYTEAASFAKNFFPIFDKRGMCFLLLNRFSEAIADFEHSLSIFPHGKETLYNCAKAYYRLGNHPKAIEKLEQLVRLDEGYEDAKTFLVEVRTKLG